MPAKQLLSGTLEAAINALLALDDDSAKRLQPLKNKRLTLALKEFPWPLTFVFSDRIDILMQEESDSADCTITLQLSTLNELKDSSQITRLLQQGKLDLQGDIHVAQHFSTLIKELNIDWEEHLSHYIGDVAAYQIGRFAKQARTHLQQGLQHFGQFLSEGAIEEKRLTPHALEIEQHLERISQLRGETGKLATRIASLESQQKQHRD